MNLLDQGNVKQIDINTEMRESYLSYAMSVIVSRALPDARDGLKPVHRRILYAMHEMHLRPNTSYKKSARVVGEVLGKYHPHGDQSVYDAMVRMAQDFSMRYPLVDGQGNFGSIDGDPAAAMRYTEARMSNPGFDLLEDIGKETVDFATNFDESLEEPLVLPATIPNLLVNGATGIAVGMATSIPPHNLGEVVDALTYMLDRWDKLEDVSVADLMQFIKGPDFPTGGLVFRYKGAEEEVDAIAAAYGTGRGKLSVRAKVHIEHMERKKSRIVITELPYQINKTNLLGRIADLHRSGKIEGLTDLRDESDRNGMRIVIETTRTVNAEDIVADLFRLTPMQSTFSVSLLALVKGEPRILTLKQALRVYIEHRLEIVRRRSEYDLRKARERAHILEGLMVALDNLDAVIATIRKSRSVETARKNLIKQFKLSVEQAQAILDMQLRRLAAMERRKIQDEYKGLQVAIKRLVKLLADPKSMRDLIGEELAATRALYADNRRTQILDSSKMAAIDDVDLLPDAKVWVLIGEKGTIARTSSPEMVRIPQKPAEQPRAILGANTQDLLYLFAADGTAVSMPVYQLPQARAMGVGKHFADLTGFSRRRHLAAALVVPPDAEGSIVLTTVGGMVKRARLDDLPGITSDPFTVIGVGKDDALGWAKLSANDGEVMLATAQGRLIRFKETAVRGMGLAAAGVMGVKLAGETDGVVTMELLTPDIIRQNPYVWSVTDNGLARATLLSEYPSKGRNGQGVWNVRLAKGASEIVSSVLCDDDTQLLILMTTGEVRPYDLAQTKLGTRAVIPRKAVETSVRNHVMGVTTAVFRPEEGDETEPETAGEQLALI